MTAEAKQRVHPVQLFGKAGVAVVADPVRLEQSVTHLVQNAIDVIDSGAGMSADFIRTRLFQPFASTKDGGFGIGAFEARALIAAMGGRIEVESREGEGSRFTIILPAGTADGAAALPTNERIRA